MFLEVNSCKHLYIQKGGIHCHSHIEKELFRWHWTQKSQNHVMLSFIHQHYMSWVQTLFQETLNCWKWHTKASFLSSLVTMHLLWTWCLTPGWAEVQKSKLHSGKYRGIGRKSKEETMETFRLTNKEQVTTKNTVLKHGTHKVCISYYKMKNHLLC